MKEFEVITKSKNGLATWLTKAKTPKGAIRNLVNRSGDFRIITEDCDKITIKVKPLT